MDVVVQTEEEHSRSVLPKTGSLLLFAFLFSFLFSTPASANTSVFANTNTCTISGNLCQALSVFGVLTGDPLTGGDTLTFGGKVTVGSQAVVGVQTGGTMTVTGTGASANSFANITDFADPVHIAATTSTACAAVGGTPNPNICGTGSATISPTPQQNNALVSAAGSQLTNIETNLGLIGGTSTTFLTSGSIANIEGGTNYNSTTHVALYKNTAAYAQNGAITIGCTGANCANDLVIIQLTSGTTSTFNNSITLTGGLTSDQVIFYFSAAGVTVNPTAGVATINADFFLTATKTATIGGTGGSSKALNFEGRIYGSNILFNNKGVVLDDLGEVPEPGTWAMMAGGLGLAIWLRRKRAGRKDA
jgi:hypothetical protein